MSGPNAARVVSLHRPAPVSGISAAGARMAVLPGGAWTPLMIGESITREQVEASPLCGAPGLDVLSWGPKTGVVERARLVRDRLKALGAGVVVPNDLALGFCAAGLLNHEGVRCAMWLHAESYDGDELVLRCGALADAFRAVSGASDARARRVAAEDGVVLPASPGPMPVHVPVPEHAEPVVSDGRLKLLYAGRLERFVKRAFDLEALCEGLGARGVDFRLTIAGEGPAGDELRERLAGFERRGVVRFVGNVPMREMPALIRAHDLLVLVSASEGMPTTVMEAGACGRGVALTRTCGGAPALVERWGAGVVVGLGEMGELAEALAGVTGRPGALEEFGRAAHRMARSCFSWEHNATNYAAFVADAVRAPSRVSASAGIGELRRHWVRMLGAISGEGGASADEVRRLRGEWLGELRGAGMWADMPEEALTLDVPLIASPAQRRLRARLDELARAGYTRVALYGAGQHTVRLEAFVRSRREIVAIVDDRAGQGPGVPLHIGDRPVVGPQDARRLDVEAIVVSSDEHEAAMLPRARGWFGGRVIGLYQAA